MSWVLHAIMTALLLAMHQLSFKLVSQHFSSTWGSILYIPLMFVMILPLAIQAYSQGDRPALTLATVPALLCLAVTGALFVYMYQRTFQLSPSASMVLVIVDTGAVMASVLMAAWLFDGGISTQRLVGVGLAIGGIILALKG